MEYYIVSLFISFVIFLFVYEKKEVINEENNTQESTVFTLNNFMLFVIIYIVITIFAFYTRTIKIGNFIPVFLSDLVKVPEVNKENIYNIDDVDPKTISKISENIDIGFIPPHLETINEIPDPDIKIQ